MNQRKILFIDKTFQLRYAGWVVSSIVIAVLLVALNTVSFYYSQREILQTIPESVSILKSLVLHLSIVLGAFAVLVSVFAVIASHRFAGPIYRFKKVLEELEKGDLTVRAFLREKDELDDLREMLNRGIKRIHTGMKSDREKIKGIKESLQKLKSSIPEQSDASALLSEIEKRINEIGDQFKI